jgi:hypothetical protein
MKPSPLNKLRAHRSIKPATKKSEPARELPADHSHTTPVYKEQASMNQVKRALEFRTLHGDSAVVSEAVSTRFLSTVRLSQKYMNAVKQECDDGSTQVFIEPGRSVGFSEKLLKAVVNGYIPNDSEFVAEVSSWPVEGKRRIRKSWLKAVARVECSTQPILSKIAYLLTHFKFATEKIVEGELKIVAVAKHESLTYSPNGGLSANFKLSYAEMEKLKMLHDLIVNSGHCPIVLDLYCLFDGADLVPERDFSDLMLVCSLGEGNVIRFDLLVQQADLFLVNGFQAPD